MPGGHQRLTESAGKKAACPVRPRTGLSCPVTDPDGWAAYRPPGACGCPPCFFSAAPFKAVELRSTPGKLLKKFDQNFFAPPASLFRPCGTQEGGLSRPATDRLVPCGHAPALAARKKAACPVRPRTGLSCAATHRLLAYAEFCKHPVYNLLADLFPR
mgnify:CR=1 FL=1